MEPQEGTGVPAEVVSTETAAVEGAPGPEATAGATPAPEPAGINPAWEPIREVLGDDLFNVNVRPHLQKMDESAHTRITNLNNELKSFEGFKPFVEQGLTPQAIQQSMELAQLIEANPQQVYDFLGQHLGVAPVEEEPEGLEQFGAGQDGAMQLPQAVLDQLAASQQFQQQYYAEQQERAQMEQQAQWEAEAAQQLDQQMSTFLQKNPTLTEADKGELFRAQYDLLKRLEAQGINRMPTLDEAAEELQQRAAYFTQRFGAGNGAPNPLPTTTGGDIPGQQPNVAKMSKHDLNDLVAQTLATANAANQS